jgi:hypothetical protein
MLLAVFGLIYGNSEVARREILHQLYSFLDRSSAKAVEDIASSAGKPTAREGGLHTTGDGSCVDSKCGDYRMQRDAILQGGSKSHPTTKPESKVSNIVRSWPPS